MAIVEKTFRKNVDVYKANSKNTGAAAQFSLASTNICMFLECARQIAPMDSAKPYDWENKICVKLGLSDIGKFLAYLRLPHPETSLKLYHESPDGGNKTIELKYQEYKGQASYFLSVSAQKTKGDAANRISLPISLDEVELLFIAFQTGIQIILGWGV